MNPVLNKWLTKGLVEGYDILQGRRLSRLYNEIRSVNKESHSFDMQKLNTYLDSWGVDDLTERRFMEKKDLRSQVENISTKKKFTFAYTGGSTGEPLKIPYSKDRSLIRTASIRYYNEIGNYFVGDRFLFIRAKPKSRLTQLLRNELLCIPSRLDDAYVADLTARMISAKTESVIGYPSVMYEIAHCLDSRPELKAKCRVKSLISVSEPLDDIKRAYIQQVFNCTFVDRYSTEEVGVIAQQYEFGGDYIVDRFGVFVEVLDPKTLEPVSEGKEGRVVVTDTNADIIPIIRYNTGDNAIVGEYRNRQVYSLKKISGRKADTLFTTKGIPISSLMLGPLIHKPFSQRSVHCQFQLIQLAEKKYELRIKDSGNPKTDEACREVENNIYPVLGRDAELKFSKLPEIPPLPSGKRPLYLNLMTHGNNGKNDA